MRPESQDTRTEMNGFALKYGWGITIIAYRKELESEDLWGCLDKETIKHIFQNTFDEDHRNKALKILIEGEIDLYEAIDLLYEHEYLLETEAGLHMTVYLSCLLEKMETYELQNLFYTIFMPGQKKLLPIAVKVADEIAKRDKMPPAPNARVSKHTIKKIERRQKYQQRPPPEM